MVTVLNIPGRSQNRQTERVVDRVDDAAERVTAGRDAGDGVADFECCRRERRRRHVLFMKRFVCVCFMRKRTENFCILDINTYVRRRVRYRSNLNKLVNIFDDVGDGVFDESFHRTEDDFFERRRRRFFV